MRTWEILGIEATIEVSTIKRAYAKKLKIYHPEDDPQGFQMLREAYDSALKYAKDNKNKEPQFTEQEKVANYTIEEYNPQQVFTEENNNILEEDNFYSPPPVNILEDIEENYNISEENNLYTPPPANIFEEVVDTTLSGEQLVEDFFEKAANLYNNFFDRIEVKNWQELLNDDIMWRFDCKELINNGMLQFLMKNYFFPGEVWHLLNGIFRWDEQKDYLNTYYPESFVKYLLIKIRKQRGPRYCYFDKNIQIEYDKYIYYREEALQALHENNFERADEYISLAYKMYDKDPDLLCMRGEYYLSLKKIPKALSIYKKAASLNREDEYIYLYQVETLCNHERYREALNICVKRKAKTSKNLEWRTFLGICYIDVRNWKAANKVFQGSLKIDPNDIETRKYLLVIANHFQAVLKKHPSKLRIRKDLKKLYRSIGEINKLDSLKITPKLILTILKKLVLNIFMSFVLIILITEVTGSAGIAFLATLIYLVALRLC